MFDLSWSEIALVGVVALIVIGPKDLPNVLRTAGKWVRKIRSLGSEFQRQMDDVMRETGAEDVRRQVTTLARTDVGRKIDQAIDPDGKLAASLSSVPPPSPAGPFGTSPAAPPSLPPQAPAQPVPPATGAAPPSPSAGPDRRTDGSLPPQD